MAENWDVVVVGGGLAGLAAGSVAAGHGSRTLVLESHRPGGRASTDQRGRYRMNRGAHALYRGGPGEAVLGRLGVSPAGAAPVIGGARARLGNRLELLPTGPSSFARTRLLRTRSKPALARFLAGAARWRPAEMAGLSVAEWLDAFDLPDDARLLAGLFVRLSSYLADESASADVAATQLALAAGPGVRYLHNGWSSLVESLLAAARRGGAEVRTSAGVGSVEEDGGGWLVRGEGLEERARAVVVAGGSPAACAPLTGGDAEIGPPVEAACLDLGLRRPLRPPVLLGVDRPLYLIDHASAAGGLAPTGGGLVHGVRYLQAGEDVSVEALRAELEDHAWVAGVDPADVEETRFLRRITVTGVFPPPAAWLVAPASRRAGRGFSWPATGWAPRAGWPTPPCQCRGGRHRRRRLGHGPGGQTLDRPPCCLMTSACALAEVFAGERPRLVGLAYRITGSLADAEDVVQEAWLRLQPAVGVERPEAWLATVVSRLAFDALKAARRRREAYVGPWLPEPVASDPRSLAVAAPDEAAELAESLTIGFLHVLETLDPVSRVVFILADVFAVPFRDIAATVGRSEMACRQVASRARRRVRAERPGPYRRPDHEAARVVGALLAAATVGDVDEEVGRADGGGGSLCPWRCRRLEPLW